MDLTKTTTKMHIYAFTCILLHNLYIDFKPKHILQLIWKTRLRYNSAHLKEKGKYLLQKEQENAEGRGRKYSEKENIWSEKQKKIGGGKEGKYFERTNIWFEIGKNWQAKGGKSIEKGKC